MKFWEKRGTESTTTVFHLQLLENIHNRFTGLQWVSNNKLGGQGGHGAILQKLENKVILVFSDLLISNIDVGALDFTGKVCVLSPFLSLKIM